MTYPPNIPRPEDALPAQARALYDGVRDLPIVSPHGHCDPRWWADNTAFPDPAALLIIPDHYDGWNTLCTKRSASIAR